MTLYTSVYWTKRVLVVLALLIFLCGGFRLFQFIGNSLTEENIEVSEFRPEVGFGRIDRMTPERIELPSEFRPQQFRISTTKGNLDVDNGYPLESTRDPIANVYRITERQISLATTEDPIRIARKAGFTSDPTETSSTGRSWEQQRRTLSVEGLYLLIEYKNNNLRQVRPEVAGTVSRVDQNALRNLFNNSLRDFDLTFPDAQSYTFDAEYINFNSSTNDFEASGSANSGAFIKINARRAYPNLVKTNPTAQARAIYQGVLTSNNYVILPANLPANQSSLIDSIAELSFYNWPVNQTINASNRNVQTYPIKTPRQAYNEIIGRQAYLMEVYNSSTRKPVDINTLTDTDIIDVLSVRIDNFETKTNNKFIVPMYVFTCELLKNNERILLIYYVPAILDSQLN